MAEFAPKNTQGQAQRSPDSSIIPPGGRIVRRTPRNIRGTGEQPNLQLTTPDQAGFGFKPADRSTVDSLRQATTFPQGTDVPTQRGGYAPQEPGTSGSGGGWKDHRVPWRIAGPAAAVGTILIAGATFFGLRSSGSQGGEKTQDANSNGASTANIGEGANSTPPSLTTPDGNKVVIPGTDTTKTPESTKTATATATATPETVTQVPCVILPQEYCDKGGVIERVNKDNKVDLKLLAFKLSAGTPIYAAADGDLIKGNASAGILLTVKDLNNTSPDAVSYGVQGDIKPAEDVVTRKVKKGDIIGYTQDTGVKLPFSGVSGDYNVAVFALDSTFADKSEQLKDKFPTAFKRPPVGQFTVNAAPTPANPTFLPPKYAN